MWKRGIHFDHLTQDVPIGTQVCWRENNGNERTGYLEKFDKNSGQVRVETISETVSLSIGKVFQFLSMPDSEK